MDKASEAVLALKPVTFRYKKEIDAERSTNAGLEGESIRNGVRLMPRRPKGSPPITMEIVNHFRDEFEEFGTMSEVNITDAKMHLSRLLAKS